MNKQIITIFFSILIAVQLSCTGKIIVKDDDFTKAKTLTMYLKPSISDWSGAVIWIWENEFYREIKNGKSVPTIVSATLMGADLLGNLDKTAMIKVNDKVFDLQVTKAKTEKKTGSTDIELKRDYGDPNKLKGTGSSMKYKQYGIRLSLTPQVEKEMENASSITLRLSLDNKPVTIVYSRGEVDKLKKFVTLNP